MAKVASLLNRKTLIALGWTAGPSPEDVKKMRRDFAAKKKQESDEEMIRRLEKEWEGKKHNHK